MMRMLLVITAVSLTFVSGLAYGMAGVGGRRVVLFWRLVILGLSMSRSTADAASEPSSHG